jgi:hypothetical protein
MTFNCVKIVEDTFSTAKVDISTVATVMGSRRSDHRAVYHFSYID